MPNEPIKGLSVPDTGTFPGTWGSGAINPDIVAIGAMLGGVQSISLSSATSFALSAGTGSITPGAGPTQSQNAILKFSGTLSGNAVITLPLPGYYIVKNACVVGSNYIQMRAVGTGNLIGLPPGKASKVWCDGTDVDFCDTPEVGSYLYLAAATTPGWFAACTVQPFLPCHGATYSTSVYPALGAVLGSTFGGNGASTFGVPDLQNRVLAAIGISTTRLTPGFAGFNGTTLGATGGSQALASHDHTGTVTDSRTFKFMYNDVNNIPIGGTNVASMNNGTIQNQFVTPAGSITVSIASTGAGGSQNVQPTIVGGIALIKT